MKTKMTCHSLLDCSRMNVTFEYVSSNNISVGPQRAFPEYSTVNNKPPNLPEGLQNNGRPNTG